MLSSADGCYYISYGAKAFGWTQLIPSIFNLVMITITAYTKDPFWFIFGLFLYLPQVVIWSFQRYFQYIRPDPICQLYHSYAFPSLEAFYIGVIVGLFVIYVYKHDDNIQPWTVWLWIYLLVLCPSFILVFYLYNRWWEVLFSLGFGFFVSLVYWNVWEYFIKPLSPYLENYFPLWTFNYIHDPDDPKYKEVRRALENAEAKTKGKN